VAAAEEAGAREMAAKERAREAARCAEEANPSPNSTPALALALANAVAVALALALALAVALVTLTLLLLLSLRLSLSLSLSLSLALPLARCAEEAHGRWVAVPEAIRAAAAEVAEEVRRHAETKEEARS
jgi:hypothetical protein